MKCVLLLASLCLAAAPLHLKPGAEVEIPGTWAELDGLTAEFASLKNRVEPMLAELQALQPRYEKEYDDPVLAAKHEGLSQGIGDALVRMDDVIHRYRRALTENQYKMLVQEAPKAFRKGVTEGVGRTSVKIFAYDQAWGPMNGFLYDSWQVFKADNELFKQAEIAGGMRRAKRLGAISAVLAAAGVAVLVIFLRGRRSSHA